MPDLLIGVYWKARDDGFDKCVDRLHSHFEAVCRSTPGLSRWFLKAWRRPKVPKELDVTSRDVLSAQLAKGVNRTDIGKEVITDLGWTISVWNGDRNGLSASTSVGCNCTSKWVGNNALIDINYEDHEEFDEDFALSLLRNLIEIWHPEEGRIERSRWNPELEQRVQTKLISYEKTRLPILLRPGTTRFAQGVLRT